MEVFDYAAYEAEQKILRDKAIANMQSSEFYRPYDTFMYGGQPICQVGFEYDIDDAGNIIFNCVPSYMVEQKRVYMQAQNGQGFIFRDISNNSSVPTLVKTCPSGYAPRGIECVSYNDLNLTTAEYIAMENQRVGMIPVKDGVTILWFKTQAEADKAQLEIDKKNALQAKTSPEEPTSSKYSERQTNINTNVCSVDKYGSIVNPASQVTNGMNLSQYVGQFKVTEEELALAKSTCPDNIVSESTFGTQSYEKDSQAELATNQAIVRKNETLKKYALYAVLGVSALVLVKTMLKKD